MDKLEQACLEYDPDEDIAKYRGSMGIALAEASLKKCGYDSEKYKFKQQLEIMKENLIKKKFKQNIRIMGKN